jgi:hypothetical protein
VAPNAVGRLLRPICSSARRSRSSDLAAPFEITVTSPAFSDGGGIPIRRPPAAGRTDPVAQELQHPHRLLDAIPVGL